MLVLVGLLIGLFLYFGWRKRKTPKILDTNEEIIPLNENMGSSLSDDYDQAKGKERDFEGGRPIFDIGDNEDEDEARGDKRGGLT